MFNALSGWFTSTTISKKEKKNNNFINNLPTELFIDIITFLPLSDIISILILSKDYYKQFNNHSLLFYSLCNIICKNYYIPLNEINNEMDKLKDYKKCFLNLFEQYVNLKFDISVPYYKNDQSNFFNFTKNKYYSLTNYNKTISVFEKPLHSDFITIYATKELKKGNKYKIIFKLNDYNPNKTMNTFKIMVGLESKYFFPWCHQSSLDVIGWEEHDLGLAFIVGQQMQLSKPYSPEYYDFINSSSNNPYPVNYNFKTNDCIVMEVDLTNILESSRNKEIQKEEFYSLARFSVIDCNENVKYVGEWIAFGNSHVTYVPAVGLNVGQSVSIYSTERAAGVYDLEE
ncbi:hypothetical protein ABK040_002830 [Willaertia magna]